MSDIEYDLVSYFALVFSLPLVISQGLLTTSSVASGVIPWSKKEEG